MSDHTLISVGATPQQPGFTAQWVSGETADLRPVRVDIDDAQRAILIRTGDDDPVRWAFDDIRALRDQAGGDTLVLRPAGGEAARLYVSGDEAQRLVRARARALGRRVSHVRRSAILVWGLAAIGSVALILLVLVPFMADRLATFLPPRGEKALGDATFEQIRDALDETGFAPLPLCEDPEGLAALKVIEDRLVAEMNLEVALTVKVLDHGMVNAFALPGGYVVFFRGLIDEAENPEELAAVFAHEIGHVDARDPTRIALRSAGSIGVLGLLFGDFAGGAAVLFLTERIIQADYTREAEAAADEFAHAALLAADLPPSAIASFFDRLRQHYGDEEGIVQHFMSHPAMGDRIAAAQGAEPEGFIPRPLLSPEEWAALQGICDGAGGWIPDWRQDVGEDDLPPLPADG